MSQYFTYWQEDMPESKIMAALGNSAAPYKQYAANYIESNKYKSVLDCGGGIFNLYDLIIENNTSIKYVGTEITKKFVEMGKQKNLETYQCSANSMPVPDNYCEVVICLAVLNHQFEFKDTINELLRVAEKEVVISFFKPFVESDEASQEIEKNVNRFPILSNDKDIGTTIQRHTKFVYTFFSKKAIEQFLDKLKVKYVFHTLEDKTVMLHILKNMEE